MAEVKAEKIEAVEETEETVADGEAAEVNGEAGEEKTEAKEDAKDKEPAKEKKATAVFFLPAVHEFKADMTRYQISRSVVMGPVRLEDLNENQLASCLHATTSMQMGYRRASDSGEYTGYVQLVFGTEAEAKEASEMLANFREGVFVKHCVQPSNKEPIKYDALNQAKEYGVEVAKPELSVTIPDLKDNVTEDDLMETFANAKLVYIPQDHPKKEEPVAEVKKEEPAAEVKEEEAADGEKKEEKPAEKPAEKPEKREARNKNKRYAYISFATAEEATAVIDSDIKIHENDYRVYKLETLPPVDTLIRSIDAERLPQLQGVQLSQEKKLRLYNLRKQAMHYIRTDYLPEKKMTNLQKRMDQLTQVTRNSSRGRGRGRGAYAGAKRRGGMSANQTPQKRPRQDPYGYSPRGMSPRGGYSNYGGYGGYDHDAWAYDSYYGRGGASSYGYGSRGMQGGRPMGRSRGGRGNPRGGARW